MLREVCEYLLLPEQRRSRERLAQHRKRQLTARELADRREAEMPWLRLDAGAYAAIGAKEAVSGGVDVEPGGERREDSLGAELGLSQLHPIAGRCGLAIEEVQIGAPMVPARARQGRPAQDFGDALRRRQGMYIDELPARTEHRPIAAVFAVPNRELAIEIAKAARDSEFEAAHQGRALQALKCRLDMHVHRRGGLRQLDDVGARPAGQFVDIHGFNSRPAANSAT